jgi:hypothetical protein
MKINIGNTEIEICETFCVSKQADIDNILARITEIAMKARRKDARQQAAGSHKQP